MLTLHPLAGLFLRLLLSLSIRETMTQTVGGAIGRQQTLA